MWILIRIKLSRSSSRRRATMTCGVNRVVMVLADALCNYRGRHQVASCKTHLVPPHDKEDHDALRQ